ncbi:voltage-dependent calcium channel gamma-5 subunit isoform X2 [Agrilus planipennis]|uniref:Voltage-dependent calcium channel gamma-5 subunit isoform X2 n=1 Tax=Agrilus planipennis TaxID=224129 RepID=A0A1W4WK86_AGRPL|nr:voltage-dependent calcium channel gamma-5 subunit isoform X2 [Agrilus planipennis]
MQRTMSRNSLPPSATSARENSSGASAVGDYTLSCLWVLTPVAATLSLVVIVVATSTNQWLHTEEKMNNPTYNGTGDDKYLSKVTVSGLWAICIINPGETRYNCSAIDYFSKEEYNPDPSDSTMAIPYAVTKSVFFFALATLLVAAGYICCLLGQCSKHRRLFTFVSGVVFVVSGLVMLLGVIMYISVFKSEVGSKLRPKSQLHPPIFNYRYGYSFLLYLSGIVASELAGLSAIFLFICRMQETFRLQNLEDVKLGKAGPSSVNYLHVDQAVFYPCQRHPQAYINSNSSIHVPTNFPSPVQNRRYFFDKQQVQESPTCVFRRERSPHANSLKDISASYFDFPPPPTISYQFEEMKTFNRDTTRF